MTDKDVVVADCGCKFWTQGDALVVVPCSKSCPLYLWTLSEIERQQKPIHKIDL